MSRFIIYLFETGLCLSLLYLAYWLFLRKETYFNFIRIYLVGSLALAMLVPLVHVNYVMKEEGKLRKTAESLEKFRNSYEELISMLDADFGAEPGLKHRGKINPKDDQLLSEAGGFPDHVRDTNQGTPDEASDTGVFRKLLSSIHISGILLLIYIGGVMYFLVRFIYLIIRLRLLAKRNEVSRHEGFRIVEMKENISPFSFFRFLFINSGIFNEPEFQSVLEHEKAHIKQKHSLDHLFAHGLAVFQWFNPFAWQIRKALKTTHEYIADRQVLNKGFELFDYQTILLKQVIGYHAVELVNNFNLKPIKKRIAMMTKNKPGFSAKMKATLVIPIAILTFFLFADFSLRGRNINDANTALLQEKELIGFWVKKTEDQNPEKLLIEEKSLSILIGSKVEKIPLTVANHFIHVTNSPADRGIKYEMKGTKLVLKWNDKDETAYEKVDSKNTLEQFLKKQNLELELPSLTQYRIMEDEQLICRICINISKDKSLKLRLNGIPAGKDNLKEKIEGQYADLNQLNRPEFTIVYYIDKTVPMGEIIKIRELVSPVTRRFAEGGYPYENDHSVSPLLFDKVALPRILPPPDAPYVDIDELKKQGLDVMQINLAEQTLNPPNLDQKIQDYIKENEGRYLISLMYDKDLPYGRYLETVDKIFNIIYKFRNNLAMEKYGVSYGELGDALQRQIRKTYPVAMSEKLVVN